MKKSPSFCRHQGGNFAPYFAPIFVLIFCLNFQKNSWAVTLTSGQTDYSTTSDITTDDSGIISSLSGTSTSLNKITNNHVITTGNDGANSSAYGIRVSGDYYQIQNSSSAKIITTGSSGRGISISDYSTINNYGSIATEGSTAYGLYAGGNSNNLNNYGSIITEQSSAHGIYANGESNSVLNSATIQTSLGYGIYLNGNLGSVTNSGQITTTSGSTAYGIYISSGTTQTATSTQFSSISNSGTISSNSHGIYNKDNYAEITNSGTISPTSSSSIYGINSDADNVTITNSGTISANRYGIYNSGSNVTINNSGDISGGIRLSSGVLNISGGTISGIVDGNSNLGRVVISPNSTFTQTANFEEISSLTLSDNSTLNSKATIETSNIYLGNSANLNLYQNSQLNAVSISGISSGQGNLNLVATDLDLQEKDVTIGSVNNMINKINIDADSTLTAADDIYSNSINVFGTLNFNQKTAATIHGDVSLQGGATLNIADKDQNISGDFTLSSQDILSASMQENGQGVGSLNVLGAATISSESKLKISTNSNQGFIASGTKFLLVSGQNSSQISAISDENIFLNSSSTNVSGLLRYSTTASGNDLYLQINRLEKDEVTSDKNLQKIYTYLNQTSDNSTGNLLAFQEYLDGSEVSNNNASEVLSQMLPLSAKAIFLNNFYASDYLLKISQENLVKTSLKNAEFNLWAQPLAFNLNQNDVAQDVGFKTNAVGLAVGADKNIDANNKASLSLAFARSTVKSTDELQQNLLSTFQVNFSWRGNFAKFYLENSAALAWQQHSAIRSIKALGTESSARFSSQSFLNKIKLGQQNKLLHGFSFAPEIGVNFFHNQISAYQEKGAKEVSLEVEKTKLNYLESELGTVFSWRGRVKELSEYDELAAAFRLSYAKVLLADKPKTTAKFLGQSDDFEIVTNQIDQTKLTCGFTIFGFHQQGTLLSLDLNHQRTKSLQSFVARVNFRQSF